MISPLIGTARVAVVALAAGAVLGLTACGDGGDAARVTTIAIRPESYALKPPATPPSTAPVVPTPDAEGRSQAEQSYTIHEDEYPFEIAALFDVELEALRNFNSWDADYSNFPGPGGTARIPPGAKFVDPAATTTTVAATTADEATGESAEPTECGGTYPLEEGDYPVDVARKFDVTVDALLAANGFSMDAAGNVASWPAVGTEIQLPAGPDCATATTASPTTAPAD
jgi:hypothetical protein